MKLIGRKLTVQLHHPDINVEMPRIEGKILKFVRIKRFKLFGCIIKLSTPFNKSFVSQKEATKIREEILYAILTKRENIFSKLTENETLNLMVSFIVNNKVLKNNPDSWKDDDVIGYSFGESRLIAKY
jgi:hypothetical protein